MSGVTKPIRAGQPWYTVGLLLVAVGIIGRFMFKDTLGNLGDFVDGVMLGMGIAFLVVALVAIRRAKATGGGA